MKTCLFNQVGETKIPKTNEEYREYLKKKGKALCWIPIAGLFLAVLAILGEFVLDVAIDDYMLGIYSGFGTGLVIAGIALTIKNRRIMKDEEKLKKARLEMADERIREIGKSAFRMAAIIMIVAMYVIGLIGGLFYPILPNILFGMVCLFLVAYVISYKIYEKKM